MTTEEVLKSVETNLRSAYNSLENKRAKIPEKKNLENLASTVNSIEPLLEEITIDPKITNQVFTPSGENDGIGKVNVKPVTSDIDANIIPSNIRKGKVILGVVGNVEVDKPDQEKTVNPTRNTQSVVADTGYELSKVTINAVTSSIDNNIQPSNIKKGVSILGVTGNLEGTVAPKLQEKSVNPTTSYQSVTPDYGYDGLSKVNVQAVVPSNYYKPEQTANVTPSTYTQTINAPSGSVFNKINVSAVTSTIDGNIQEENIKKGVTILGVTGTMEASSGESSKFSEFVDGSLTSIEEADLANVTTIRPYAFNGSGLITVAIPGNVKVIGEGALGFCFNMQSLSLAEGIEEIGKEAFANTSVPITLPSTLKTVGIGAFAKNTALTSITIPSGISYVESLLFLDCTNLTEVTMEATTPPTLGVNVFPDNVVSIYVPYSSYDAYVSSWSDYADKIVRLPAKPSTITVTVNNYLGEFVSGASVTITGNNQVYTGTTDSVGVFSQGDLQPATYTISVADLEGFKTPSASEVVVEEDTQNSVTVTYLEKPALEVDPVLSNNSPATISAVSALISANNMTSVQVEETYGWKIGDKTQITLTTGEDIEMRIIGFNHDNKSDGSGKAGITLQTVEVPKTLRRMNISDTNAGGYPASPMKTSYFPIIKETLPQEWQDVIKLVDKKSANGGSSNYSQTLTTSNDLFFLSAKEVFGNVSNVQDGENEGNWYEYYETHNKTNDRVKKYDKDADGVPDTAIQWWLRSCPSSSTIQFSVVNNYGTYGSAVTSKLYGTAFGFCV